MNPGRILNINAAGMPFFAVFLILGLAALFTLGFIFSLPFFIILVFLVYFFRDPERFAPTDDNLVISPADGYVLELKDGIKDPLSGAQDRLKKISIFMTVFSVHVNRSPIEGRIKSIVYSKGRFFKAYKDEASLENESNLLAIERKQAKETFYVKQIAGVLARRIRCWVKEGDSVQTGERFGIIKFGSRVEIFMPENYEFALKKGDRVRAGQTVIGRRVEKKN